MSELLQAAKAVIDATDIGDRWRAIVHLRTAVDRAEKQEAVGFDEFLETKYPVQLLTKYDINYLKEAWTTAQLAERERCREIVITMGGPDVPELLRQIDSGED